MAKVEVPVIRDGKITKELGELVTIVKQNEPWFNCSALKNLTKRFLANTRKHFSINASVGSNIWTPQSD